MKTVFPFTRYLRNVAKLNGFFLAVALLLAADRIQAANILLNTNFSANSGQNVPTSWTYFEDPTVPSYVHDYWIGGPPTGGFFATPLSGTQYWKQWGAGYFPSPTNNVSGIYQVFSSSLNSVYQASGWFYTSSKDPFGPDNTAWIDVSFLDAGGNVLALYTSGNFSASVGIDGWFQFSVTNACNLSSPVATGDPYFTNYAVAGTVTQMVAPAGTASVRFRCNLLQTAKEGGSCYFDDPALTQLAGLQAPVINNLLPQNMIFYPQSNRLSFNVTSPSGSTISNSAIHLLLNGSDVSGSLVITGSTSNKAASYNGLQSNTTYSASITVTDVYNLSASVSTYFETTWVGVPPILYLWEAEDFDFTNGMYIDFPDLCIAPGDNNCYFGTVGTPGVDEQNGGGSVSHLYRAGDAINIDISGDLYRENLFLAGRTDYEINPFNYGDWMNYTRDWSNGTYWLVARLATDINLSGSLTLSKVNPDTTTTDLGKFSITNGHGWTSFENVFLIDSNGNKANIALNGKATLRVTSGGNLLPTFFALVAAQVDLPILSGMYPDGTHPLEYATNLVFTLSTVGASFPPGGIKLYLDGFDVSSNLVITGPATNLTVTYPDLLPNASHFVIITATNSLGHGIAVTNQFDTFNDANYMVEASDFDFSGGQYITSDNYYPNAYYGYGAITNVDYQHTTLGCEQFPYRPTGLPQEQGYDWLTSLFVSYGGVDYDLGCYGPGDWANYTRQYPAGNYFVYIRTAGLGSFSMYLQQVVSGVGTVNQVVKQLGTLAGTGINNLIHTWVPLTDAGLAAPTLLSLNGVETLRIGTTTGDCYPNYLMLVPAVGVTLSAKKSGGNVGVSFPSQVGVAYRIFSRGQLGSGNWNYVTNVMGTGSVVTVPFTATTNAQFYTITAP
jgi:hypothetical protein